MGLRECPFCGKSKSLNTVDSNEIDYLSPSDDAFDDNPTFAVVCNINKEGCGSSSGFWDTPKQAAIAWNTRPNNWISVEDRLPDTTTVLGCNIEGFVITVLYMSNAKRWVITPNMSVIMDVTHWQPLPEPPKGSEN